jgi:IS30 family transposase
VLRRHKKRRRQCYYGAGRGLIPHRTSIHDRPESIENRVRFGHWEGDPVAGAKGTGGVATHVERTSRLWVAGKLGDQRAETFSRATAHAFRAIPKQWRKTFTVGNGKAFAGFKKIEAVTGMNVYVADLYSPWQRAPMKTPMDDYAITSPRVLIGNR